jgi:hypothetical protein
MFSCVLVHAGEAYSTEQRQRPLISLPFNARVPEINIIYETKTIMKSVTCRRELRKWEI